jgi:N6-L-threonylcarbamoyladenine synthase
MSATNESNGSNGMHPSAALSGGDGLGGFGGLILGIESSCDETAAAVVRHGTEVLSNVVASQIALHADYGGVVPELASREHLRNIVPVVRSALRQAGIDFAALDAVAVTQGPGLAGALLVGITYAKALALGLGKPLIAVNHLEGHIHAVLMQSASAKDLPLLALVVSGGHTHLYIAECSGRPTHDDEAVMNGAPVLQYRNVGRTVDDAAGEAFDKVAKLLGLGYPGGPWMDALAGMGNPRAVEFRFNPIKPRMHIATADEKQIAALRSGMTGDIAQAFDFSFSGIKTAVLRYIQTHGMSAAIEVRRRALSEALKAQPAMNATEAAALLPWLFDTQTLDLIASFQYAVAGNLIRQTLSAAEATGARAIVVSGGVAANSELRRRFTEEAAARNLPIAFPTLALATDNAAMIAAAAWPKFLAGDFASPTLTPSPQLRLGAS